MIATGNNVPRKKYRVYSSTVFRCRYVWWCFSLSNTFGGISQSVSQSSTAMQCNAMQSRRNAMQWNGLFVWIDFLAVRSVVDGWVIRFESNRKNEGYE
mmetsp:Transcript_8424/g.24926  ORF Transcript_8424/g.24926 Transcript_8424/m.24926 type:complete len:98 (-) Transcript_8424:33-326(-)